MNWTNELLGSIDPVVIKEGYPFAAGVLTRQLGVTIHPEQLRGARRRWLAREKKGKSTERVFQTLTFSNGQEEPVTLELDLTNEYVDDGTFNFPKAVEPDMQDVLVIPDHDVLVLGDTHAPFHDVRLLERAVTLVQKHFPNIKHCAIIGDLIDFSSISRFTQDNPTVTTAEIDVRAGGAIVRELLKYFDVWICQGNHDGQRVTARLNSYYSLESILCGGMGNTNPKLHITSFDYMMIGDDTIVGHPSIYSRRATFAPNKAALLLKYNVITGHSHRIGLVIADDGEHYAIDNGHCANAEYFYYHRRRLNTFSHMASGFSLVSQGKPMIFGEAITDWSWWGV